MKTEHTHTVTLGSKVIYSGPSKEEADAAWEKIEYFAMDQGIPAQYLRDGVVICELEA